MKLIRVEDAAEILTVSVQRVYELVRTNVLPPGVAIRLGRQVRINEVALRDWLIRGGQSLPGGWRREPEISSGPYHLACTCDRGERTGKGG